jgi:predicted nucleic acid-binding protein
MFLLDTNTVIYSLKGDESVRKNISRHITDPMKISAVTLMELYYGAYKSQQVQDYVPVTKAKTALLDLIRRLKDTDQAIAIT